MTSGAAHVGYPAATVLMVAVRSARASLGQRVSSIQWRRSLSDLVAGDVS